MTQEACLIVSSFVERVTKALEVCFSLYGGVSVVMTVPARQGVVGAADPSAKSRHVKSSRNHASFPHHTAGGDGRLSD